MKIQETLLGLERGIHLADMLGLNDADLNRLERACYQWQQAAAIELCRRAGMRPDQEGLPLTIGAGKTSSAVAYAEGRGHD
jgi:hypothetical protein